MNMPLHPDCRELDRHPSGLIAVEKAVGVLSHPNGRKGDRRALLRAEYDPDRECYTAGGREWFLLNRLDAPTSGILLLAERAPLAMAVREAFANHVVEKEYVALVRGPVRLRRETWRDHLLTGRCGGRLRTRAGRGPVNAETEARLLQTGNGPPARALLSLRPLTGRTHQLRVQCASRRMPIIGDGTYGDFAFNRDFKRRLGVGRLLLHSRCTRLEVFVDGGRVAFGAESPLPEGFTV